MARGRGRDGGRRVCAPQAEECDATVKEHRTFQLAIDIEGSSPDDVARGVAAAQAVFAAAGTTPAKAARGLFSRDSWDDQGFPQEAEPTEAEFQAAAVWEDADSAAAKACCANWPAAPSPPGSNCAGATKKRRPM